MEPPSQREIDAVAHFVEAARELRQSPFFIEEYRSLSISKREGGPKEKIQGHFPDPSVVRGTLVPFRRIWHQNEPCHYTKVTKILKRYMPEFRGFLDSIVHDDTHSAVQRLPWSRDVSVTLRDVIDVWLNTRYHHVGRTSRVGRFTRADFDSLSQSIGPVVFEFFFLSGIQEVGMSFFNIQQCAESFLRVLERRDLRPSFQLGDASTEENVERTTPGFTPDGDSPAQRVWRLRRRRHYDGLNSFLDLINCSDTEAAELITLCSSFDDFVNHRGIILEHSGNFERIDMEGCTSFRGCLDNYATATRNRRSRRGFVAERMDGTLLWAEDYVPVLRDQYVEFRTALQREPFK